jgi:hypothetical protein
MLAAAFAAVLWSEGPLAQAAPAGAAQGLYLSQQGCGADGTASAVLNWTPSGAGSQTVDIAIDPSFANFSRGGPFASNAAAVVFVGMHPGTTYYTRVNTATSSGVRSSDTLSFVASCQGGGGGGSLTPPTGLTAYSTSTTGVVFSWQRGNSNSWFCVNVAQTLGDLLYGGPTWRNYGCWTTSTSLQVNLNCGTTYYWNVFAWNDVTNGTSDPATYQTPACVSNITPPTNLKATPLSPSSERLSWDRGNQNYWFCVNTATSVNDILYGGPSWHNYGCWMTNTTLDLTGLPCNTTFYWNVYAWNNVSNTTSNYTTFTTQACAQTTDEAPIDALEVNAVGSNPTQYVVHIVAGLPNGCHTPGSYQVYRHGTTIDITVLNNVAPNANCTAIYGQYELNINVGSDFASGQTYTVNVNDKTTTFTAQ